MLFQKKPTRENTKVRLRALETEPVRAKIPPRLAISMIAPFAIVAIVLWVFSKQTSSSTTKKASEQKTEMSSTTTPDVPPAPPAATVEDQPARPDTASLPPVPMPTPEAPKNVKTKAAQPEKKVNEVLQTSVKPSASSPQEKVPQKQDRGSSKKEVKEAKKSAESEIAAKVTPTPPVQKDDQKVKIKEGRPRSPREVQSDVEKRPAKSETTPKPTKLVKAPSRPTRIADKKAVDQQQAAPIPPQDATPKTTSSVLPTPSKENVPSASESPSLDSAKDKTPQKISGRSYKIQVGSFQNKDDAEKLAFRLKEHGYDVSMAIASIPNKGDWHRVRVGHYADRALAEKEGGTLASAEHLSFFITSDP